MEELFRDLETLQRECAALTVLHEKVLDSLHKVRKADKAEALKQQRVHTQINQLIEYSISSDCVKLM
jgi:hypothetical protein